MPETTAPSQVTINASSIVERLELKSGVSAKTGNPYTVGTLYIRTRTGRPYALDLKWLDENAIVQIEEALEAQQGSNSPTPSKVDDGSNKTQKG